MRLKRTLSEVITQGAVLVRPDGHVAWRSNDESGEMAEFSWLLN